MSDLVEATESLFARLDFAVLFDDEERLLKVRTALPALALLPEHLHLREAVSQPFELVLDCISPSANFELKRLLGEQITVSLKQADGSYSPWHGYVVEAAQLGSDGGLARYRLTMGPWLDWLSLRTDSFVFQDKTALEIVEEVFADYPAAKWRIQVSEAACGALRKRSLCTQYRESDLRFVSRLLADEGLHYWFEHLSDADGAEADAQGCARHVMVVADAATERADLGPIRFTAQHPSAFEPGLEDPVVAFMSERRLTANAVALGSWDYRTLAGTSAAARSALDLGDVPTLEVFAGHGAYRWQDSEACDRAAERTLAAIELHAKRFDGIGAARRLRPGARFSLIDHPSYGADTTASSYAGAALASHERADNAFTVLAVEHEATNNLGSQAARLIGRPSLERGTYRNRFGCVLGSVPVVSRCLPAPTAPAALTARVVGIEDSVVTAERGHRIKVQMHFQRGERPNAGGGPTRFGSDSRGNAPGDERAGTWVRVSGPVAGANWGSLYTPRIGSEVALQFIDGDIDRPVIVGGLFDGTDAQSLAAGVDSGVNHPGVISGLHSQRLDGAGFNQLALDDAPGQLRARLHASHASAELGLGHLIQQSADSAQRGAWRGSGFEAGTAGWASVRAGQGLFVSTTARAGTYGSAVGVQMEASEALAQLRAARELGERLGAAARSVQAEPLSTFDSTRADGRALAGLIEAIDPTQAGRHPAVVNGQAALQPGADGRTGDREPVPAFATASVVLDTPAALLAATSATVTAFAGQAMSFVAQGDLQQTAAHTSAQASGGTTSLYAHAGGVTVVAANGLVSFRAHTDALSILADRSVTVTSVDDEIRIAASQEIRLVAGQSAITLKGGDIEFATPGAFTVHGATHGFEGAGSQEAELHALPEGLATEPPRTIELNRHYDDLFPIAGAPYKVTFAGGNVRQGQLDDDGHSSLMGVPNESYLVEFGEDPRPWVPPPLSPVRADYLRPEVQAEGKAALEALSARLGAGERPWRIGTQDVEDFL